MKSTHLNKIFVVFISLFLFFLCNILTNDNDDNGNDDNLVWIEWNNNDTIDSTIYYVSTSGENQANGTSDSTAFRTIAQALKVVKPGGEIRILPGTYTEAIGLINCGSSSAAITITGYQGIPLLDGQDTKTMAFFCEDCLNMIFSDLLIQNYTDIGIGAENCRDFILQNLIVRENGHAVQLKDWELEGYGIHVELSENILITDNDVYRNGPQPQIFPNFLMGTGINTYGNRNLVIRNNLSHENIGGGILVEDSFDILVEDNEVYENDLDASADEWWDGGIWIDGGGNVTVRGNTFRDNLGPGIEISDEDLQKPTGYILENNVSTGNYYGIFIWNFGTTDWPPDSILHRSQNQLTGNSIQDVWIEDWF